MLGTAVDIQRWLDRDQSLPVETRHERDRAIAARISADPDGLLEADMARKRRAVLDWWQDICAAGDIYTGDAAGNEPNSATQRLDIGLRVASVALGAAGFVLGLTAAAAALTYTGAYPVNLVSLLALLVLLPGLLLLASLALLPARLPGFGWLRSMLTSMNLGHWLTVWLNRFLPQPLLGFSGRNGSRTQRVSKWLMLRLSQCFAIGFFLGAVAALLWLVVFSDLAFGWSTTLQADPARVATWFQAAAAPWSAWYAAAYPSAELVGASRFFRGDAAPASVAALGAWWPFVLMCLLVYGLLPRISLYLLCRWRYDRAVGAYLLGDRNVQALLQRMVSAWVQRNVDAPDDSVVPNAAPITTSRVALPAGPVALLVWNEALPAAQVADWCAAHDVELAAPAVLLGSTSSLATEQAETARLAGMHVLLLTKAWEPPLLELHDMLQRLAQVLGRDARIYVLPLGLDGVAASDADDQVWRQSMHALQHPQVLMASPA